MVEPSLQYAEMWLRLRGFIEVMSIEERTPRQVKEILQYMCELEKERIAPVRNWALEGGFSS